MDEFSKLDTLALICQYVVSICGTHICLNNIWLDWILCFCLDNRFDSIRLERTRLGATDGFLSRPISL